MKSDRPIFAASLALVFLAGCGTQTQISDSPVMGTYVQCGSVFSGTSLSFLDDNRIEITIHGDDGPWIVELSGKFQVAAGSITASEFETIHLDGPSPHVGGGIELVWEALPNARDAQLEMTSVTGTSLGSPWFSVGSRYARTGEQCD